MIPAPDNHRQRHRVLAGSLLALAAALAGGIALGFQESPGQVQHLPDGSLLELRGCTYGPNGAFFDGNGWQRALYRLGKYGTDIGGYLDSPANSELNLWFRYRVAPDSDTGQREGWIDEHGCRIRADGGALGSTNNMLGPAIKGFREIDKSSAHPSAPFMGVRTGRQVVHGLAGSGRGMRSLPTRTRV